MYYSQTISYVEGRDGLELWVNEIEEGHNYSPILGHGPCELSFSLYGGYGPHIRDAFTLDLPQRWDERPGPRFSAVKCM